MEFSDVVIRLLLGAFLGSLIGLEREYHGRPAGLRTHMLVCVGATMITLSALIITGCYSGENAAPGGEVSRIVAGVVTGIGFLGAGAIVRQSDFVSGLTTAACIWFVAALGVIIGLGDYYLASTATGIALVILVLLPFLENRLADLQRRELVIKAEDLQPEKLVESCSRILEKHNVKIGDMDIEIDRENDEISLLYHLKIRKLESKLNLLDQLSRVQGVNSVQWQRTPAAI
ncbi:MAG: MgtC/SapB family protein [Candidatus Aegiribacteria sp.]|nr:MgtC/SapB family protein [Candidatus Aegiribacteria sp.]MBD3295027.1 MgtC/SapB family protein [Candidatus Fermentibacteria bacterium]